jgi:hypothetical protein
MLGCVTGFLIPHCTYPRSMLTAHLEFTSKGVLQTAMGWATGLMSLSPTQLMLYEILTAIGTWANGAAFVFSAYSGQLTPLGGTIMGKTHPPPGGFSDLGPHHWLLPLCAICIMGALGLGVWGLVVKKKEGDVKKME